MKVYQAFSSFFKLFQAFPSLSKPFKTFKTFKLQSTQPSIKNLPGYVTLVFIPMATKGKSMADFSDEDISFIANTINQMPHRILKYTCPDDLFEVFWNQVYAL